MKSIYSCNYKFYRTDLKPQKIVAISDLHFDRKLNKNHLRALEFIKQTQPDHIMIAGDTIENIHVAESPEKVQILRDYLTKLGQIAPVCIGLGNHDSYRSVKPYRPKGSWHKCHYISEKSSPLKECVTGLSNIFLLDNDAFEDESAYVFGLSLPADYYENLDRPGLEKKRVLLRELDKYAEKLKGLPADKAKILLAHSPVYFADADIRARLKEFDLVFAGHTHNGAVPPGLQEIWRGKRGIMSPHKRILSKQIQRIGLYKNQLIVLGAITTITGSELADSAFPTNVATIEIVNEVMKKPRIKRAYKRAT